MNKYNFFNVFKSKSYIKFANCMNLNLIFVCSLYDTYDKIKDNDMIVPFKNIINAIYSKDIGRKVKSSFALKMKKGEFLGTYAPYGFLLDENRKLIIDPEASENVKRIFEMYANGESMLGICKTLTREGIDIPSVYKLKKGIIKNMPVERIMCGKLRFLKIS